jgi:WhiB family redox-sensing transcriptional regulator
MGGTTNVVRIFGNTFADYGVQPDGDSHDWSEEALCANRWDEFQPDREIRPGTAEADTLAAICAECPVLAQCRDRARETDARFGHHGFWAGLTESERRIEDREVARVTAHDERMAETDAAVHRLNAAGVHDREIASRLDIGKSTVARSRKRQGLHVAKPLSDGRGGARGRSPIERQR